MMHMDQWSWILLSSSLATFGTIYFFWNAAGTFSSFQVKLLLPCFGVYRMVILERFLNLSVWYILVARNCTIFKTSLILVKVQPRKMHFAFSDWDSVLFIRCLPPKFILRVWLEVDRSTFIHFSWKGVVSFAKWHNQSSYMVVPSCLMGFNNKPYRLCKFFYL